jgi:hypothetical protein
MTLERRAPGQAQERQEGNQVTDKRGDRDDEGTPEDVRPVDGLKVQLLVHHRCQPGLAVGHDGVDHPIQQVSREPLRRVDIADLLPLPPLLRWGVDMECGIQAVNSEGEVIGIVLVPAPALN